MFSNVRSLINKRDELEVLVQLNPPTLVALAETWLTEEVSDAEVAIRGYNLFRADRANGRHGGGVALYIRDDIPVSLLETFRDLEGHAESIWCRTKLARNGYDRVSVIYRSPGSYSADLFHQTRRWATDGHCLVLGDFNMPYIDWSCDTCSPQADLFSKEFHALLGEISLYQHVRGPTRLQVTQASTLDLVLSPRQSDIERIDHLPPLGSSDHSVLAVYWRRGVPGHTTIDPRPNVWRIPFDDMRTAASEVNWPAHNVTDVETVWRVIRDELHTLVRVFAPKCSPRPHAKGPPWFDRELRACLRSRNRAWRRYRYTGEGYDRYKLLRNQCTQLKKSKRANFENRLAAESVKAPKRLYAYLKRRTRARDGIPTMEDAGVDIETAEDKADLLARHYSSVYSEERPNAPALESQSPILHLQPIQEAAVAHELRTLNTQKSPGPDGLHPLVLKELAGILAPPLTYLFNLSLQTGILPQEWKKAIICPMYKGGPKKLGSSYRPVSLTSIIGKVMERLVTRSLREHLESNQLLHQSQHGFRANRSCISNLLLARERWAAAKAEGYATDVIFVDFSKAFDKVPHNRLLVKLKSLGVQGSLLQWIESFLKGRTFSVRVAQSLSPWFEAKSGVPQGSVLGPILFLVFINDLPTVLRSECLIYADDVKLWRTIHSETDRALLQEDINRLQQWAADWMLPINVSKCAHMHIGGNEASGIYYLNGSLLRTTRCERDLGIMVTSTLKTHENTDRACASARAMMGAIRRSFSTLSAVAFTKLYATHVRPRLEYGNSAAFPCTSGEEDKLERVQRSATRLVAGLSRHTYEERLEALGLFPQRYRRIRGDLICIRRILRGSLGPELQAEFPLRNCNRTRGHRLVLRKMSSIGLPLVYRLSRRATNLWNALPAEVAEETNDAKFKRLLDNHLEHLWRSSQH